MPMIANAEERKQDGIQNSWKKTLLKFFTDFKVTFLIWIKIAGILSGIVILLYLVAKFILNWDVLYETNVNFTAVFLGVAIGFILAMIACWLVAFFLYNTKHRRNTKYKLMDIGRGGYKNG
jgi:sterol desaturase/sphingolipid hydroxylase (fatty acid hydroxylase superfamily)